MQTLKKTLIFITIFSIAMGFLESSVVVYLRELYYPGGNLFPLVPMKTNIIIIELLRESATLIMLLSAGFLAGRNFSTRFAWFIYSFAIWDIFYYFFLKLILNWPESLLTWDILFLLPTLWTGPVIAPLIISLSMIIFGVGIIFFCEKYKNARIQITEWSLLISGSLVLIIAFSWDYNSFLLEKFSFKDIMNNAKGREIMSYSLTYIPRIFNWFLFIIGQIIIFFGILLYFIRNKKLYKKEGISHEAT